MALNPNIQILRNIIAELRSVTTGPLKENYTYRYIMGQYKKFQTTDQQLCRAQEEVKFMSNTYLCYLKSSRLHRSISEEFHGKGERTVAETAKMVGFKLPHDPK